MYQYGNGNGTLRENNAGDGANDFGSSSLDDGEWHNVVLSITSGVGQKIYVDGALELEDAGGSGIDDPSGPIYFGRYSGGDYGFPGSFDEIAIWNSPLTLNHAAWIWNDGAGNTLLPPIATIVILR
jgi:hypothetical protein